MIKRKIMITLAATVAAMTLVTGCGKKTKTVESFPEKVAKLNSYKITGKLYTIFPSGTKECLITSYYQKPNNYRVEIDNVNMNDKQIIIKNSEGVSVLIPSLNKTFQIKSEWPNASSYPYIFQSLANDIVKDEAIIKKEVDGKQAVELKAQMHENALPSTQIIVFNKETGYPDEVQVYDENKKLITRFVVTDVKTDIEFNSDIFNAKTVLESVALTYVDAEEHFERSITYPTYFPEGVSLKEENVSATSAIMNYGPTTSFTIVEEFVTKGDEVATTYIEGDIIVMGDGVIVVNDNNVFFYQQGLEYTIASNVLSSLEMIKIGDSLLTAKEK